MTTPGLFSDFQVHQWLSDFARCWVGLHYDNPETAGAYASEIFGGAYARIPGRFNAPTGRATWNTAVLNFTGLPAAMVTHLAVWDASVSGNYLGNAPLSDPVRILAGGRYEVGAGQFALSFRG